MILSTLFVSLHSLVPAALSAAMPEKAASVGGRRVLVCSYYSPEIQRQADIRDRIWGNSRSGFDAIDERIDSMIKTVLFSRYKSNPCREITKE